MRHIYRLLTLLFMLAGTACYSQPAPQPVIIDSQARTAPSLQVFQANERTFRVYFRDGGTPVNVAAYVPFMSWSLTNTATSVSTSSWSVVNSSSGVVDFTFSPAAINTNGTFIYEVGLAGLPLVYRQGVFQILRSPYASGAGPVTFGTNQPYVVSLSSTGAVSGSILLTGQAVTQSNNVFNIAAATGSTGTLYSAATTSAYLTILNPNGPQLGIGLDYAGLRSGLATGTPLYVEAGTGTLVAASLDPYMTGALSSNAFIGAASLSTLSGSVATVSGSLTGYAAKVGAVFHGPVTSQSFHVASGPAITASGTTNILIGGVRAMLEGEASGGGGSITNIGYGLTGNGLSTPLQIAGGTIYTGTLSGSMYGGPVIADTQVAVTSDTYTLSFISMLPSDIGGNQIYFRSPKDASGGYSYSNIYYSAIAQSAGTGSDVDGNLISTFSRKAWNHSGSSDLQNYLILDTDSIKGQSLTGIGSITATSITAATFSGNLSGNVTGGNLSGNGAGMTNVDAKTLNGQTVTGIFTSSLVIAAGQGIVANQSTGGGITTNTVAADTNAVAMIRQSNFIAPGTNGGVIVGTAEGDTAGSSYNGRPQLIIVRTNSPGAQDYSTGARLDFWDTRGAGAAAGAVFGIEGINYNSTPIWSIGDARLDGNPSMIIPTNAATASVNTFGLYKYGLAGAEISGFYTTHASTRGASVQLSSAGRPLIYDHGTTNLWMNYSTNGIWANVKMRGPGDAATNALLEVNVRGRQVNMAGNTLIAPQADKTFRVWLSTNEYIQGTGTGSIMRVSISPASTNWF